MTISSNTKGRPFTNLVNMPNGPVELVTVPDDYLQKHKMQTIYQSSESAWWISRGTQEAKQLMTAPDEDLQQHWRLTTLWQYLNLSSDKKVDYFLQRVQAISNITGRAFSDTIVSCTGLFPTTDGRTFSHNACLIPPATQSLMCLTIPDDHSLLQHSKQAEHWVTVPEDYLQHKRQNI